jgi:galactokinase
VLAALLAACARQKNPDAELLQRRVRHVLIETQRVPSVAACLQTGNVAGIGPYLTAFHRSMRNDYEITTPAIDLAVATAINTGALGARMTGGGYGGCVIALVPTGTEPRIHERVTAAYLAHGYPPPGWFTAMPSAGTRVSLNCIRAG